ncbi:hypothetical protein [Halobacteriovorax sp. HLS]|uniref:hypothetical protein n=1 Tax=Halobacteriovorax sp. HLS TaxID=2234000 RepID=UPI000FDA2022|nr:hypothetical protein [Halobacteriovorax sp. HLS]
MRSNLIMANAKKYTETISVLILLTLLTSINAYALERTLLSITNDENSNTFKMVIDTNENEDIEKFYKDTFDAKAKRIERKLIALDRMERGVNIEKIDGHEIVNLKSDNFASHNGGNLELDTLYNGAKGTRKSYQLELDRIGDSWEVLKNGKKVSVLHLKSNKVFLLGTVGIKDIQVKK